MTHPASFPLQPAPHIRGLASSLIREVADIGMAQSNVLPFWFGESDQTTPQFIREEAIRSLSGGETFYTQNLGRPYLREAIANYLTNLHERPFSAEQIVATNSGVTGLLLASELLLSPHNKVVIVTPLWPNIGEIPKIFNANVTRVSLKIHNNRWALDLEQLLDALTPDTRALILNSPNNPTGWTIDDDSVGIILQHCRKHGIWVISDDVYERLVHDSALRSAPSFLKQGEPGDRLISVNSFSKAWLMTGWRAGWMVVPSELTGDLAKLIEYNTSCMFEPVQRAAVVALHQGEPEITRQRAMLTHTRTVLTNALARLPGVEVPDAGGAMYVFFRIAGNTDSVALAKRLVLEAGLGLAPGAAFGPEGNGWLRWCHAVSDESRLLEGVSRLEKFLENFRP